LLQLRSQSVREPHTWSIPGGARGKDETPEQAALREAHEEANLDPQDVKIVATYSDLCECGWNYTTLIANPIGTVELHGNWEGERLELVPLEDVATLELHPGFKAAWPALRDMLKAGDTQPNISQITEQLWTGGDRGRTTPATWLAQLQHAGITHVIDARQEGQPDQAYTRAHAPHIGYLHNPQPDLGQTMPDQFFDTAVDYALHAMADPDARVLAHCQLGHNRGPSMAFALLLATGATPQQARSQIVDARPIARIRYADQATRWWANLTAPIYYHGGKPGMHIGDILLPPTITGVYTMVDIGLDALKAKFGNVAEAPVDAQRAHTHELENHRVFVTKDLIYATEIAAAPRHHNLGTVYRVQPLGNLADSTNRPETTCDRARILGVVMEGITWDKAIRFAQEELARRKATR
jgi:8-oxo-dGTP pyrophosphatase MutT (NUDIX family)